MCFVSSHQPTVFAREYRIELPVRSTFVYPTIIGLVPSQQLSSLVSSSVWQELRHSSKSLRDFVSQSFEVNEVNRLLPRRRVSSLLRGGQNATISVSRIDTDDDVIIRNYAISDNDNKNRSNNNNNETRKNFTRIKRQEAQIVTRMRSFNETRRKSRFIGVDRQDLRLILDPKTTTQLQV